ncbi:CPBP family intramembrane glutamic endopeptidase [Halospeciosus flavus]|uniref:CPBP family intramembrane glutamic endopeptidase n=1 Tax=Halospeciosus flavus TaxID=3032283 RepID=UPI0036240F86
MDRGDARRRHREPVRRRSRRRPRRRVRRTEPRLPEPACRTLRDRRGRRSGRPRARRARLPGSRTTDRHRDTRTRRVARRGCRRVRAWVRTRRLVRTRPTSGRRAPRRGRVCRVRRSRRALRRRARRDGGPVGRTRSPHSPAVGAGERGLRRRSRVRRDGRGRPPPRRRPVLRRSRPLAPGVGVRRRWTGRDAGVAPPPERSDRRAGSAERRTQRHHAGAREPQLLFVLFVLSWVAIGPGEELLNRNVVQKYLYYDFSRASAIVVGCIVFTAMHGFAYAGSGTVPLVVSLVNLFCISLVLGVVYERTDNVVVPIFAHAAYDAVQFAAAYVMITTDLL